MIVALIPVTCLLTIDSLAANFRLFTPSVPQADVNAGLIIVLSVMLGVGLGALVYWALGRGEPED